MFKSRKAPKNVRQREEATHEEQLEETKESSTSVDQARELVRLKTQRKHGVDATTLLNARRSSRSPSPSAPKPQYGLQQQPSTTAAEVFITKDENVAKKQLFKATSNQPVMNVDKHMEHYVQRRLRERYDSDILREDASTRLLPAVESLRSAEVQAIDPQRHLYEALAGGYPTTDQKVQSHDPDINMTMTQIARVPEVDLQALRPPSSDAQPRRPSKRRRSPVGDKAGGRKKTTADKKAAHHMLGETSINGGYFFKRNFRKTVADLTEATLNREDDDYVEEEQGEEEPVEEDFFLAKLEQEQARKKAHQNLDQSQRQQQEDEEVSTFAQRFHLNPPSQRQRERTKDDEHYQHQVQYLQSRLSNRR